MINLTAHIQLSELAWTLVAVLGAYFAFFNLGEATKDRDAVEVSGVNSTRQIWASFSVSLHRTLIGIEMTFAGVGVIAMGRRPSPGIETVASILLTALLIGASGVLSLLSYRWRQVDKVIRASTDEAMAVAEQQEERGESQDTRQDLQDVRKGKQDDRGDDQDVREVEQNIREVDQNTRDKQL